MSLLEVLGLRPPKPRAAVPEPEGRPTARGDSGDAGGPREPARSDTLALLTPLHALAEGGIADAALRGTIAQQLAPLQAAFDKADKLAGDAAAVQAFVAIQAPARKLLARAELFQKIAEWDQSRWQPLAAALAGSLAGIGPAAAKKALQAEFDRLDQLHKAKRAGHDLAGLQALEPRVTRLSALAGRIAARAPAIDAELARLATLLGELGTDAPPALAQRQADLAQRKAKAWPDGANLDAIEASLTAMDVQLQALGDELAALKAAHDARLAYQAARAQAQAAIDEAVRLQATPGLVSASAANRFSAADQAVDLAVTKPDWPAALAALPALVAAAAQVRRAPAEKASFDAAYNPLRAELLQARAAVRARTPLPGNLAQDFVDADNDVNLQVGLRDWPQAQRLLPTLQTRTRALLKTLADGRKFYEVLQPQLPVRQRALDALDSHGGAVQRDNAKLSMLGLNFWQANKAIDDAVAASDWGAAKKRVEAMRSAAIELVNASTVYEQARVPFDTAEAALTRAAEADRAAETTRPGWAKQAAAYLKQRTAVGNARDAGDFARATGLLPGLQAAIDTLLAAKDADDNALVAYGARWNALRGYAEAKALQGNAALPLADKVNAFNVAEAALDKAREANDWAAAAAAVPPLQAAIDALHEAQARFNTGFGAADETALRTRIDALKPRTDAARDAPVPAFVATAQQAVLGKLADLEARLAERDFATAQAAVGTLEALLRGMEHDKAAYAAHRAKFDAVKNGPIARALGTPLAPPKLDADRRRGLAATEARIVQLADAGKMQAADAALPAWETEARGWGESKAAFDALAVGSPDVKTLEKLAKAPGGEAVLDKLIANLDPNRTPGKVLVAALKARYGFDLKHFTDHNKDETDLDGLHGRDEGRPDPDLQKLYALMSKIPSKRIKGKIDQMISFDQDESRGVYYPNKKIYLFTDRPGKTGGSAGDPDEQDFGVEGKVMPPGQKVQPACEPKDTQPVAEFDFVLLHEVGHAEDDGAGFMKGKLNSGDKAFAAWNTENPKSISKVAAAHFGYDQDYLCDMLEDKNGEPPRDRPDPRDKVPAPEWERRRVAAVTWCREIRAKAQPWESGAVSQQIAIGGRVYQEAYNDGRWFSYDLAARAQGITAYQFRAPGEWFAELYAAHFSNKLKKEHPAMGWLSKFKPPE